jgi:zinc protease
MAVLRKFRIPLLVSLFLTFCLGAIVLAASIPAPASVPPHPTPVAATTLSTTEGTQKTILDNGLTVLTKEVHTAPVVSVQMWYKVGSRNEPAGENGISHQLEHLMFKGTTDRPIQFGRFFNALGSQSNAFTSYDMTAYYGTVEQDKLEAMLILEADRMANTQIGESELDSEKRVVISELQGFENSPDFRLSKAVLRAAMPDRAYGLPVGGTKTDVQSFTVEAVQRYYQTYYTPDNAILVITGDFETATLLPKVEAIFGQVPKRTGNVPVPGVTPVDTPSQSPILLREPGSTALLNAVYPLVEINHPDVPAIDLLDTILTVGRSSRFYQALVESGLASAVSAYPAEMVEPGWYEILVTAAPNQSLEAIDRVLLQTLDDLRQNGVSQDELDRAKTQLRTTFVLYNQDITSQGSQLGYYEAIAGDYRYGDRYLAAVAQVKADDIQRVAQTYFDPAKRTVGRFEPTLPDGSAGTSGGGGSTRLVENFDPGQPVDPAEVARYLPDIADPPDTTSQATPETLTLDNGLRVVLLPNASTPMINLSGWVEAGSGFDTIETAGLASLTAANLMNGTQTQDALTLANTLEDVGASLEFASRREGTLIEGYALNENLSVLIQTLANVLHQATFPSDQLELSRQRALSELSAELDDPQQMSWRVFRQTVYPKNHPLYTAPTQESLTNITQVDLVNFYQTHYRPDTTVLSLVGDFDSTQVKALLSDAFADWSAAGDRPNLNYPTVSLPASIDRLHRVIPGKAESVTVMGHASNMKRQDPRYYPALVLNEILGGDTLSSRLGTEIRDRQGLTYGIYSFFQAGLNPGPFAIFLQTAPEDAPQAIDSTLAVLNQLRNQGVTPTEIEAAKRSLVSSYSVDLSDPTALSSEILFNDVYQLGAEEIRDYPAKIEAVTPAQVQQALADLIHPNNLVIVTTGPGEGA